MFFDTDDFFINDLFLSMGLLVSSALLLYSAYQVRVIRLTPDAIQFLPVGKSIFLADIKSYTFTYPEFFEQRGELNRIVLEMQKPQLQWVPFCFLWAGHRCSIQLAGIKDANNFKKTIDAMLLPVKH
jgi:hypothetical protein